LRSLFAVMLLVGAAGCSAWPRASNLPGAVDAVPGDTPPGSLFSVAPWTPVDENESNDDPTQVQGELSLELGTGYLATGTLDGFGWYHLAEPRELTDEACPSVVGDRSPGADGEAGDYVGDVDTTVVTVGDVGDGAQLCARVEFSPSSVQAANFENDLFGWDLLLFPLHDGCKVPEDPVMDGDAILGADDGGPADGWGAADIQPGSYAVQLAGFFPNEEHVSVDYTLALSLVHPTVDLDGNLLCPDMPPVIEDTP
jgi:hypothetical protein